MKRPLSILILLALGVLVGIGVQRFWLDTKSRGMETQAGPGKQVLYYRNPMNASITSDKPTKDNMGMDYIPVYADETSGPAAADSSTVTISPTIVNNLGVRTARVERGPLSRRIDSVGYVSYDESVIHHVHLRAEGWVEKLPVKFTGDRVNKGDLLLELYSPKLVNAQEEYIQSLSTGNKLLLGAARARLHALGVPDPLIDRLEKTHKVEQWVRTYALQDGVVMGLNIREGMYVEPATEVMSLASLSDVWVLVDVFEQQSEWVQAGQQAEMRLSALPGKVWRGTVDYVYPSLDPATRTLKVRLRFDNPGEVLKPNMYADVNILAGTQPGRLSVPREALIRTGEEQRVIMALGDGKFAPRKVRAGMESGDRVEIRDGLKEGEQVVASGQFLIDSESSLNASLARMTNTGPDTQEPLAQDTSARPGGMSAISKPGNETEQTASGRGVVKAMQDGKLTISHEPIASLHWPAMTMDFQLAGPEIASGIQPGDKITFQFHQDKNGAYLINKVGSNKGDTP